MNWNAWIRQMHRWVSVIFTLVVLVVTFLTVRGGEEPAEWVYLTPLLPLALLFLTGAYLFVLPYIGRRRRAPDGPGR